MSDGPGVLGVTDHGGIDHRGLAARGVHTARPALAQPTVVAGAPFSLLPSRLLLHPRLVQS